MSKPPAGKEKSNSKEGAITDRRVAVDRQKIAIPTRDGNSLKPNVFLWGKGSSAFPPIRGTPRSDKDLEYALNGQVVEEEVPTVDWRWCAIPIERTINLARGGPENDEALLQLGTYVREILTAQENRRFVPSLILTECIVEFLL
jgi:hypothetical protein